jgi:hypothetical protein
MGKHCLLLRALVLVFALLAAPYAHAIVINANGYKVGTNLTNAFPGIILEEVTNQTPIAGDITTSPLLVESDPEFRGNQLGASAGGLYGNGDPDPIDDETGFIALAITFKGPVYGFTDTYFTDSGDIATAFDYDSQGELIDQELPNFLSGNCLDYNPSEGCLGGYEISLQFDPAAGTDTVFLSTISSGAEITQIDIPWLVSEPSSLALFGLGLAAVGSILSRRKFLPV